MNHIWKLKPYFNQFLMNEANTASFNAIPIWSEFNRARNATYTLNLNGYTSIYITRRVIRFLIYVAQSGYRHSTKRLSSDRYFFCMNFMGRFFTFSSQLVTIAFSTFFTPYSHCKILWLNYFPFTGTNGRSFPTWSWDFELILNILIIYTYNF